MATVTGCIIAKNEEKLLPGCIDSLKPFVDEIILVDNGSTDNTTIIAKNNGCIVIQRAESEVDEGRNKYIEHASKDWLLILDADERLDINKKSILFSALDNTSDEVMQFRIPLYNYTGHGKFVETSTASRIIRRDTRIKYNNFTIHASTTDSVKAIGGKSLSLNFPIHHYDIIIPERTGKKRELYKNKLAEKIMRYNNGEQLTDLENIYVQYLFLGVEYSAICDYRSAIIQYDHVISSRDSTADMALLFKAYTLLSAGELSAVLDLTKRLINKGVFIERASALCAEILIRLNKKNEAIKISNEALRFNSQSAHTLVNLGILTEEADPEIAFNYFNRAIIVNSMIKEKFIYRAPSIPNVYIALLKMYCVFIKTHILLMVRKKDC